MVQLGEDAFGCCEKLDFYIEDGGLGAWVAEQCDIPVEYV